MYMFIGSNCYVYIPNKWHTVLPNKHPHWHHDEGDYIKIINTSWLKMLQPSK
jgi:hypothetical protein